MILITGANGFVGKNLVNQFVEQGQTANIRLFLRRPVSAYSSQNITCCYGDMTNRQQIINALEKVDTVIHLASKNIDVDHTGFHETNVVGLKLLAEACAEKQIKKFIYLSSTGVYGHGENLAGVSENHPIHPDTELSISKAAAEQIILNYHLQGSFQAIILRPRFIYGQHDLHFIPSLIRYMSKSPLLIDGGKAKVSVIHVDDLTKLVVKLASDENPFQDAYPVFHVNDAHPISYKEISHILAQKFNYSPGKIAIPSWLIYTPIRIKELCMGERRSHSSSVTSLQIKLLTYDNYFSVHKLQTIFPEFQCRSFAERFSLDDYPNYLVRE
jgi:nucleoside-diphosphate-sugar epimerase